MSKKTITSLAESAPMAEYLAHQQKIADLRDQESQLEDLIATKNKEISEANSRIPDLSHLTSQRQDILADLALGKSSEEEVAALDNEIAVKKADQKQITSAARQVIEVAEHAIAGLNRRLNGVQQEIATLSDEKLNKRLVRSVLRYHAETLGEEYIKAADQLKSLYMRLMALSGLLRSQGEPVGIAAHCSGAFEIPSFNLESCKPSEMKNWPGNLFLANVLPATEYQYATDAEREILSAAGLDCA